jgi:hypothetical protein
VLLTFHSALRKLNTEPFIGASHQVLVHLAKQLQRRRFVEIDQWELNVHYLFYKDWSFRLDPLTNMAATGNSYF